MTVTTIPRNHTRKIKALKSTLTRCWLYTLDNGFSGETVEPVYAWSALDEYQFARLAEDGESYTVRVHSNRWYKLSPAETREEKRLRLESQTGAPMIYCTQCGTGPFCVVEGAHWPGLCADCRQPLDREANGWTPENSID